MSNLLGSLDASVFGGLNTFTAPGSPGASSNSSVGSNSSDGSDVDLTSDFASLTTMWTNEVGAPSLLPTDLEVLGNVKALLKNQQELLDHLNANVDSPVKAMQGQLYKAELERCR